MGKSNPLYENILINGTKLIKYNLDIKKFTTSKYSITNVAVAQLKKITILKLNVILQKYKASKINTFKI